MENGFIENMLQFSNFLIYKKTDHSMGAIRLDTINSIKWFEDYKDDRLICLYINDKIIYKCYLEKIDNPNFLSDVINRIILHITTSIYEKLDLNELIKELM